MAHLTYALLEDGTRAKVDTLVANFSKYFPAFDSFAKVCYWADTIRDDMPDSKNWHFQDIAFDSRSVPGKTEDKGQLLVKLKSLLVELTRHHTDVFCGAKTFDELSDDKDFLMMFAWIAHLIGDLNCPAHCITHWSDEFPQGDHGGFKTKFTPRGFANDSLHSFWDRMFILKLDELNPVAYANHLYENHPPEQFFDEAISMETVSDLRAWAEKSYTIGKDVYLYIEDMDQFNLNPFSDRKDLKNAKDLSETRLALASYRLTSILNKWL
ncbi:MAG: hypothetical protein A2Y14_00015 [Verrucomicrobia bacterium GWF2_51_19]|nr:MAG: hypothetical protein A2Y14_00015 [Verrucomicrobia bacterium GWF2_51_19]